jgi:tetratricopeptide (TPR) repeat protein
MNELNREEIIRKEAVATYNKAFDAHEDGSDELAAIELANASIYLWRQVGDNQNLAIGYWLLSRIYAQFSRADLAIKAAEKALDHLAAIESPDDWLIASINECWTRALVEAEDSRAAEAIEKTTQLIKAIADPDDRALIDSQFSDLVR